MPAKSLWGTEFSIPKIAKTKTNKKQDINKILKSSSLSLEDRLALIKKEVYRILGHYTNNTLVIRTKEELKKYIDKAIENGYIAIDTETDNTLDYLNCHIVGLCLYTPGLKQAYIPINHIDYHTNKKLEDQCTENDIAIELLRLKPNNTKNIFHNYKFDYQVIKNTCGIELDCYWDTMAGAHLIDENVKASLKQLFIKYINPKQKKYDIESLFENVLYAQVDPNVFALYAATDAYMTFKLYQFELDRFETDKSLKGMYNLALTMEFPIIQVVADMEIRGIDIDNDYASLLSKKYHDEYDIINKQVQAKLAEYEPIIEKWKLTPEANYKKTIQDKSKIEQLENPINLKSPTQLAILIYDILGYPEGIDKNAPRSTGADVMGILVSDYNFELGSLLLAQTELFTVISKFIDAIPAQANKKDKHVHCQFNPLDTATGRFASKGPNLQNIPSNKKDIRPMFRADLGEYQYNLNDDSHCVILRPYDTIPTDKGYQEVNSINEGDSIMFESDEGPIYKKIIRKLNLSHDVSFFF